MTTKHFTMPNFLPMDITTVSTTKTIKVTTPKELLLKLANRIREEAIDNPESLTISTFSSETMKMILMISLHKTI